MAVMDSYQISTEPVRSERIDKLHKYITSSKYGVCVERGKLITEYYRNHPDEANIVKRANAIDYVLQNMSIYIMPGSLFAGNQASKPRWAPIFPEYEVEWVEKEMVHEDPYPLGERPADRYILREEDKPIIQDFCNWWKGKTITDMLRTRLPKEALATHYDLKAADIGTYFQGGDGHFAPDHPWLIKNGLQKIIDLCEEKQKEIDYKNDPECVKKNDFYEAAKISANAVIKFAERYADLAEQMAEEEKDPERKAELLDMAQICRYVPRYPARNFKEALQFIILTHICIQIEDSGAGVSFGRFDQFMQPYYEAGIADGTLTRDLAVELTENFFLQIYTCNKVRSWIDTDFYRGVPMFQNLTIGGVDPEKNHDRRIETIKTTLTYIQENYKEKIYIRDLADLIGMNEQYFCRFFKKVIGRSPMEYVNEYRIKKAIHYLKESDLTVTEICLECGYNNLGNFLREFRKYTSTTPLQYRRHLLKETQ